MRQHADLRGDILGFMTAVPMQLSTYAIVKA
jgi:hypothetical protein